MKRAEVRYNNQGGDTIKGILFDSIDDVKVLRQELKKNEDSVMRKLVKSGEPTHRLDHLVSGFRPLEKAISTMAISRTNTTNITNPIYHLGTASDMYVETLMSMLIKGYTVFMNPAGGMTPIDGVDIEIISETEFDEFDSSGEYRIRKGSKVINLENDYELEKTAIEFMRKRFEYSKDGYSVPLSYVTELLLFNDRQLLRVFKEFVEQGGEYVYVYTTGQNYEQMYEYSKQAINAGLTKFIFDFNCGLDDNIREFISWLEGRENIEVEIV